MSHWQPTASFTNLKKRAEIIQKIRAFFFARNVLEVETPLLSHATVTDLHLQSFNTQYQLDNQQTETLYLQTSPEFAMKRLLAAGNGPIFQICKAFRNVGESGRLHNPEFTMLEWYRPGFTHHDLMDEVDDLFRTVLNTQPAQRFTYAELFQQHIGINPHEVTVSRLQQCIKQFDLDIQTTELNHDDYLQLLMSYVIEPTLGKNNQPTFVYNFPASQAALARINNGVAERFEVYLNGMELANGFHELSDTQEQRRRFENDLKLRTAAQYPLVPIDENLLAALAHGLPDCAGIAVGIDRLVMLATEVNTIAEIISFNIESA